MRQVRLDELTYALYAGMGSWRSDDRKAVAADLRDIFGERRVESAAVTMLAKLYGCEFYEHGASEPLPAKAMGAVVADAIRQWPGELRKLFVAQTHKEREWAKYRAAHRLAEQLGDFTILRDAPEPPFFRFANFEGGSGAIAETDAEWERRHQER